MQKGTSFCLCIFHVWLHLTKIISPVHMCEDLDVLIKCQRSNEDSLTVFPAYLMKQMMWMNNTAEIHCTAMSRSDSEDEWSRSTVTKVTGLVWGQAFMAERRDHHRTQIWGCCHTNCKGQAELNLLYLNKPSIDRDYDRIVVIIMMIGGHLGGISQLRVRTIRECGFVLVLLPTITAYECCTVVYMLFFLD